MNYYENTKTIQSAIAINEPNGYMSSRLGVSLSEIHGKVIEAYSNQSRYVTKPGNNAVIMGDGRIIAI